MSRTYFFVLLVFSLVFAVSISVLASLGKVEELIEELNSLEQQRAMHTQSVTRLEDVANRLDVTFSSEAPIESRTEILRSISGRFALAVFEDTGINTVSVVERSASGNIVNRVSTQISQPQPNAQAAMAPGHKD